MDPAVIALMTNCVRADVLPALRADFAVYEEYVYTPDAPLDCPISAYGGRSDPEVTEEALGAWRDQTHGPFALQFFEGDHFFLHSARRRLLEVIRAALWGPLGDHVEGARWLIGHNDLWL